MNRFKIFLIPIFIFCLALVFRLYRLPEFFVFGTDEEYQTHYAMTLVRDFHPIWIGVSAADTGFYLGPYWTYFTAMWLKLSGGEPLVTGYVAVVIGSLTAVALYYLISYIASKNSALYSALLYATSPLIVYFDQKYWNPSTSPLLTILILLCLNLTHTSSWYFILTLILYSFTWHVHLSLAPLIIVIIASYYQQRPHFTKLQIFTGLMGILFVSLPLLIFDINHNFSNLKTPLRMFQNQVIEQKPTRHNLSVFNSTLSRLVWINPGSSNVSEVRNPCLPNSVPSKTVPVLMIIVIIALLNVLWRYINNPLSWTLIAFTATFLLYPGDVSSYYLLGALPLFLSALAILFNSLPLALSKISLAILLSVNIFILIHTNTTYGYLNKQKLISEIRTKLENNIYSLDWEQTCFTQEGWRYLFHQQLGYPAASSPVDGIFGWLYNPNEVKMKPSFTIDLTPNNNSYQYKLIPNP